MFIEEFRKMALSFPGTIEKPHFNRIAFKVDGKRIFATLHEETMMANFKFTPSDQNIFCSFEKGSVYPVPNKWGGHGWTTFELKKVPKELILDALDTAYKEAIKTSPKKSKNDGKMIP